MSYLSAIYDTKKAPLTNYPEKLINFLTEKYNIETNKNLKVLDVACGRGEFINEFSKLGFTTYSTDREDKVSEFFPRSNTMHKVHNFTNQLPFDDNSFDIIFSKSFIEHIREPEHLITESYRVLKEGGLIIIMTPDWESVYKTFYHDHTHVTPFTTMSTENILKIYNFKNIKVETFYQLPFLWKNKALIFIPKLINLFFKTKLKYKYKLIRFSKERMILACAEK